ncbi:hypothetical protein BGZ57DRAFT_771051 [Hyaloscypha finlandica]|nr:hypothetical protein BGZ57DRAFT_771051 [Hyaloscypha finlandica]
MKIDVPKILYANMLASLFTWLLLAGFIVLPATFASIRNSRALDGMGKAGKAVIGATQNIPLLWIAGICCVCGASGLLWLWWGQSRNYIWLGDRIFLPGLINSTIGLITTLVNVYTTQRGSWSITSVVTAAATATTTLVTLIMYLLYAAWTEPYWKEHCTLNGGQVVQ